MYQKVLLPLDATKESEQVIPLIKEVYRTNWMDTRYKIQVSEDRI